MSKAQVIIPLEIPDVRVLKTEINQRGDLVITVESTRTETRCQKCGQPISKFHGRDSWVTVRYLPVFGRVAYLRYRPRRYSPPGKLFPPFLQMSLRGRSSRSNPRLQWETASFLAVTSHLDYWKKLFWTAIQSISGSRQTS